MCSLPQQAAMRKRYAMDAQVPPGSESVASTQGTVHMYMATELSLGTLWARGFNARQIHDVMGLPENVRVSFLLDVGYPAEGSVNRHTPRKAIGEMFVEL